MFLGCTRMPCGYFIRFGLTDELIRFWWSNIKGPCDLTKHINGHYSIINVMITTKLYTNVEYDQVMKRWHFLSEMSKVSLTVTS